MYKTPLTSRVIAEVSLRLAPTGLTATRVHQSEVVLALRETFRKLLTLRYMRLIRNT